MNLAEWKLSNKKEKKGNSLKEQLTFLVELEVITSGRPVGPNTIYTDRISLRAVEREREVP